MVKSQEVLIFIHIWLARSRRSSVRYFWSKPAGVSVDDRNRLDFGLSIIFLFSASSLITPLKSRKTSFPFWRRMDRLAIFFHDCRLLHLFVIFFVDDQWRLPMIAIQWGLVAFGVCSQLFPRAPRMIYRRFFLVMGWMLVFPMNQVF